MLKVFHDFWHWDTHNRAVFFFSMRRMDMIRGALCSPDLRAPLRYLEHCQTISRKFSEAPSKYISCSKTWLFLSFESNQNIKKVDTHENQVFDQEMYFNGASENFLEIV